MEISLPTKEGCLSEYVISLTLELDVVIPITLRKWKLLVGTDLLQVEAVIVRAGIESGSV
jgi:hypothetical protein